MRYQLRQPPIEIIFLPLIYQTKLPTCQILPLAKKRKSACDSKVKAPCGSSGKERDVD
jgi:hypothetical protein